VPARYISRGTELTLSANHLSVHSAIRQRCRSHNLRVTRTAEWGPIFACHTPCRLLSTELTFSRFCLANQRGQDEHEVIVPVTTSRK
jgi:hypothetical protein